ncbi:MAG: hypothetical protein IT370_18635 [Deltaproteobacteria bacterium]|nr:hypothetical protein [Deltaproteobacteria bacterium]
MRRVLPLVLGLGIIASASACSHQPRRAIATGASTPAVTSPDPVAVATRPGPLTGTWTSPEWGVMRLTQLGTRVFGDYDWAGGQIDGEIVDGRLHFFWWEQVPLGQPYSSAPPAHRGDGYFNLEPGFAGSRLSGSAPASVTLVGSWRYEVDFSDDEAFTRSKWTATRTADLPATYQYQPPPYGTPGALALHGSGRTL